MITVSHDRYFLDRCVKRIFAFEENGILRQYEGNYTDYQNRLEIQKAVSEPGVSGKKEVKEADSKAASNATWTHEKKLKFSYKEQREYETIEQDIADLEEKIEALEKEMAAAATDFVKLNQIAADKEAAESMLNEKMDRWMYLEELAARIAEQKE